MVLGSWSGMKKYLEQEMLADSLKGRVSYACTHYPGTDGGHLFEVRVDGRTDKRFSMETVAKAHSAARRPRTCPRFGRAGRKSTASP